MRSPRKLIQALALISMALSFAWSAPSWAQNAPPVITAPATITAQEGVFFSVTITATAQDPSATVTLTGPSPFCGVSFSSSPGTGQATGTLSGTPGYTCAGSYALSFTASDGVSASSTTVMLTVLNTDRAPTVTAPITAMFPPGVVGSISVSASDPDGDAISSLTSSSSPATTGSSFTTNASNTSGTFSWNASSAQAGTYSIRFTASNALSGTAETALTICLGCARPPVVTAPATKNTNENSLLTFTVSASDPDGDPIVSLTAASSPPTTGSTFVTNAGNTSGTFSWTPTFTQAGSYTVTFTASDGGLAGTASTLIAVCNGCERAPTVTAPSTASGAPGSLITFTVTAADPDGDAISSFTASGTAISAGGTFAVGAFGSFMSGTFSWTPTLAQAGTYSATFLAANALSGSARTDITVTGDRAPIVTAPATKTFRPNVGGSFVLTASDPDGDAITSLTSSSSPATTGSMFTTNAANTAGTFAWTPTNGQSGTYQITFAAANALSGTAQTALTVCDCQRPPVVTAPATVSSPNFTVIDFTVTASDPDGDPLLSLTAGASPATTGSTFTAGPGNTSGTFHWAPTTTQPGSYAVTFTAIENNPPVNLQGQAITQITVGQTTSARVFTTNSSKTIKLNSGKPQWCVHVEPLSAFQLSDIQLGTVVMRSAGTGSVSEIPAITGKTNIQGDVDNNGIDDAQFCFAKGNLQLLFSNLSGHNTVNVTIAGRLMSGIFFEGTLSVDVNAGGGGNPAASITPNPLNPSGILSFGTIRSGPVRVRLFDSGGRLVRTVLDTALPAGPHDVPLDARDASGRPFASGVYFYRVEAPGNVMTGRFVVAK